MKKISINKQNDITYEDIVIEVPESEMERIICEILEIYQFAYKVVSFEMNDPTLEFKEVIKKIREFEK